MIIMHKLTLVSSIIKLGWCRNFSKQITLSYKAPNFIIIGASKCGTTFLYKYLNYHPQILLANKKELRFFDEHFQRGHEWYLAQFPSFGDRSELLTGEASPSYLFSHHVAQRIKDFASQTKLFVMLRNPVERTIYNYYQNKKLAIAKIP